jgi:hypothetical protein
VLQLLQSSCTLCCFRALKLCHPLLQHHAARSMDGHAALHFQLPYHTSILSQAICCHNLDTLQQTQNGQVQRAPTEACCHVFDDASSACKGQIQAETFARRCYKHAAAQAQTLYWEGLRKAAHERSWSLLVSPEDSRIATRCLGDSSCSTGYIFCAKLLLACRSSSTMMSHGIAFISSMSCTSTVTFHDQITGAGSVHSPAWGKHAPDSVVRRTREQQLL